MSDNLDDFLRQAAERRAKRQQEKNTSGNPRNAPRTTSSLPSASPPATPPPPASSPPASSPPASSTRQAPRPRQVFNSPNAPAPTPPAPAPSRPPAIADTASDSGTVFGSFEPSLSRRHVESDLEYADERMESHLNEAFSNTIRSKDGVRTLRQSEPAPGTTGGQASKQLINAGDLKQQLRNPQTLRLAILAQEVLKRPYQ
jgi:hypothetical protein